MNLISKLIAAGAIAAAAMAAVSADKPGAVYQEQDFLTDIRQLTTEGRRAGEGYWSPDGKRIVFQGEREPGNPFYQIYVLDLASGRTTRISTGTGKTTCAFFRPASDEILFASTHADPESKKLQEQELASRASGAQRRYAWDFDPEMEIYAYSESNGALKRLTTARGYDAEGAYSADGQWIVFSSNRESVQPQPERSGAAAARQGCEPLRRDLHHACRRDPTYGALRIRRATTAVHSLRTTASASSGAASMRKGAAPTSTPCVRTAAT